VPDSHQTGDSAREPTGLTSQRHRWARRWRLLVRRSRLWWLYQRRSPLRKGPLRRLRLLREPGQDVSFASLQLRVGRLVGRLYLRLKRVQERGRIIRATASDRVEPARSTAGLLKQQRRLLVALVLLIAVGLGLDALVREWGPDIADFFGVEHWLRETFTRPKDETLRNLLAAAAGGTATILGLVLSISLIVWQATADRYRSTTIVDFLLRERIGAAVVRLLALAFAYSLWVLALLELIGSSRPYVSAGLALVMSTGAVLSLIGYRQAGLLGYLPRSIAGRLAEEITNELDRAQRPGAGRSVEYHSRQVVAADFQILEDLTSHLIRDGDRRDLLPTVRALRLALNFQLRTKHRLRPHSLFFERQKERLSSDASEIEESVVSEGLMDPTTETPDHLWFERRVLELARPTTAADVLTEKDVREQLFQLWGEALQYAWYAEDPNAMELVLDEIMSLSGDPRTMQDRQVSEDYLLLAWLLIECVAQGFPVDAEAVVDARAWEDESKLRKLPWRAQEDARDLGLRIRREIAITGAVVTPRPAMVREVKAWREPRLEQYRQRFSRQAFEMCLHHLEAATETASSTSPAAGRMMLRVMLRMAHHGLSIPDLSQVRPQLLRAFDVATGSDAEDLRKDSGRAARAFAEDHQWSAAYEMCWVVTMAGWVARSRAQDVHRQLVLLFDALFSVAVVYSWAEFYGRPDHLRELSPLLQPPWVNLDYLVETIEEHHMSSLMFPTAGHYHWFQPLREAAFSLPDRPVGSYRLVKDHPSPLFGRAELLFGPSECLEHMLLTVASSALHVRLLAALRNMQEELNG
jgi:predicted membrane protein DUF2254